jgi:glycosyltransferase involved in cell wall biosynthesis
MEILILSEPTYPRHPGGAGKVSHIMAAALVARGHVVHLVSETDGPRRREEIDGVDVLRLPLSATGGSQERWAWERARVLYEDLARELPLDRIDLVHDSGGFNSHFFPLSSLLAEQHDLPLIAHFRFLIHRRQTVALGIDSLSPDLLRGEACYREPSQCSLVRRAQRVLCPSREEAAFIQRIYRPAGDRADVVPDPVNLHPLISPLERLSLRAKLARSGQRLILFGGRSEPVIKGADVVVAAFRRIAAARTDVRLLLAMPDAAPLRQALGPAAMSLGWIQNGRELDRLLAAVDVVWMPSRYESFGLMCAEALAAGTPVIGSPVGGLNDMIREGENGFLLPREGEESWEQALASRTLELLAEPERAARMGAEARRFAELHLSPERVAQRLESIYRETLEEEVAHLSPPALDRRDEESYLELLQDWLGPEARKAGESVLAGWGATLEQRCLSCTRAKVADDAMTLLKLRDRRRREGGRWRWLKPSGFGPGEQTVTQACPLGLLQSAVFLRQEKDPARDPNPTVVEGL